MLYNIDTIDLNKDNDFFQQLFCMVLPLEADIRIEISERKLDLDASNGDKILIIADDQQKTSRIVLY